MFTELDLDKRELAYLYYVRYCEALGAPPLEMDEYERVVRSLDYANLPNVGHA